MPTLERAIQIAATAHADVKDKQGQPYILHPIRVMLGVDDRHAQMVAVLHDVVEDTDVTLDDIRKEGFDGRVIDALDRVTHKAGQSYAEYVVGCKADPIARQVKMSDLRDNTDLRRLLVRPDRFPDDMARMERYALSYRFLTDEMSEADYLRLMQSE